VAALNDPDPVARAWVELAEDGWAHVRLARGALEDLGYVTEEVRGTGNVMVRLSGSRLSAGELWKMPGQG
jgi:hypothetical protein